MSLVAIHEHISLKTFSIHTYVFKFQHVPRNVSVMRDSGGAGADLGLGVGRSLYREGDLPLVTLNRRRPGWALCGSPDWGTGVCPQTGFVPCYPAETAGGGRGREAHETVTRGC